MDVTSTPLRMGTVQSISSRSQSTRKNNSVVVLLNDQDQAIYQKRFPNHLPAMLEPLSLHHGEIEAVECLCKINLSDALLTGMAQRYVVEEGYSSTRHSAVPPLI